MDIGKKTLRKFRFPERTKNIFKQEIGKSQVILVRKVENLCKYDPEVLQVKYYHKLNTQYRHTIDRNGRSTTKNVKSMYLVCIN